MGAVYEVNINGDITYYKSLSGVLSTDISSGTVTPTQEISGSTSIPLAFDRTAIHYDTTEGWNSMPTYVSQEGHLYIYSDFERKEEGGQIILTPAIKVGDGSSYLIDMPFVVTGNDPDFIDHINNWKIHVSTDDRTNWDSKVSISVNEPEEDLVFII